MIKTKKQEHLEQLVDELMKDHPDQSLVRHLTGQLCIPYSKDPLTLMGSVLQSANSVYLRDTRRRDLER